MDIAILIFDRITALDAIGPYEVLARLPGAKVTFVAEARGAVRTDNGFLGLVADASLVEVTRADILRGRRANTHWAVRERLAEYGAIPVAERVVRDGKFATAAGVSAGIDLALALAIEFAGREHAEAIQLGIEYDPHPPLDAGDPERAPAHVRDAVLARIRARDAAEHGAK